MKSEEYTHPDVLGLGVTEGWADPETDPTRIDWAARQEAAAIPFEVVNGRPVNPCERTSVRYGRNELGHWGEAVAADAVVTATTGHGLRWLLMIQRHDGHAWALPGGHVDHGELLLDAAVRELAEETGLALDPRRVTHLTLPTRYVPDPRGSDEAWMVTAPTRLDLGRVSMPPLVVGADDARRAAWVPAADYDTVVAHLDRVYSGRVFQAHARMLRELLDDPVVGTMRIGTGLVELRTIGGDRKHWDVQPAGAVKDQAAKRWVSASGIAALESTHLAMAASVAADFGYAVTGWRPQYGRIALTGHTAHWPAGQ
jgi:ADP-ribose pyrophosphatase